MDKNISRQNFTPRTINKISVLGKIEAKIFPLDEKYPIEQKNASLDKNQQNISHHGSNNAQ